MRLIAISQLKWMGQKSFSKALLIMNLTTAFLLVICLNAHANLFSQQVTLSERNTSLEKVFKQINRQTGYSFVYTENQLKKSRKVSISVQNASVEQVLDICFKDQYLTYTIFQKLIVIKEKSFLPKKELGFAPPPPPFLTVTGKVTDDKGQPLRGATVLVKGTKKGVQTDGNGNFSIEADVNSTLVISFVGFETAEMKVGSETNIAIGLKPALVNSGEEIVVIGYSSQRKKDIVGAVAVVNVGDLKTVPSSDAASQLQGRVSGVNVIPNGVPGAGAKINIRGIGSFTNNNPLFVVDGVQTGSIAGLNPNDIESMQVLKDAASSSIYGVDGSNGVIIVTTKKGKKKGVNVSYDMYYGSQNPGKGFELLNAQEEANLLFLSRKNSGLVTTGSVYGNGSTPVLPDYVYFTGAANNGTPILNGNPGVDPLKYSLNYKNLGEPGYAPYIIVPANKSGTNWFKEITRNAPIQSHNISVSGAGEGSRFLLSLNYFNQQAITKYQYFKRITARLNSEFTIAKGVRIGENIQIFGTNANAPGQSTSGDRNNNQENSVIAQTFRPMSILPVYTIVNGDFAGTLGGSGLGTWGNAKNPLAILYRAQNDRQNNVNIFGNAYAEIDFASHFTARTSFGGAINTNNSFAYPFIEYEHTENNANTTYNESFIQNLNWIWTNQVNYKNQFRKHNISAFVAQEAKSATGRQIIGAATGYFGYTNLNFINLSNGLTQNLSGSQVFVPQNIVSYFAKADYSFDGKYLLTALIRRDGSSKFVDPNRFGNFPAFGLGWRITQEKFMQDVKFINDLKIRGSWGKSGNQSAANADNGFTTFGSNRQSSWYDISGTNTPLEGFSLSRLGNKLTTWENNENSNIGFDATLFGSSTDVVFDFYKRKTVGLLFAPPYQAIAGSAPAAVSNVGSMQNSGIDLAITQRQDITKDIKLTSTLTFTSYKNKVTAIAPSLDFFEFNSPANENNRITGSATRNMVGQPFNSYFGYTVAGIFQTAAEVAAAPSQSGAAPGRFRYADINGDKVIDGNDRRVIGNPNPKFSYGLNLNLEYKAFDLSAFFYGVAGKDAFNFTRWFTDFSGGFPGGRSKRALYDSWLPDGSRPNATTPMAETNNNFSNANAITSYYVENASYFRMRNLQIGYTLPASLSSRAKISKARIYISGTNLFTITKYSGLDPEITNNDNRSSGVDIGSYPLVKQYLVGASINF
jgi:TonB-dependent starch-binding outer membrane protein SusC